MDTIQLSVELLLILFSVALLAGTVDTLAGGGGLITVPALLLSGLNPISALATNKIQSSTGSAMASFMMLRKKQVSWEQVRLIMLASFIGSVIGTIGVHFINTDALEVIIPIVLACIGLYFLFAPTLNKLHFFRELKPQSDSTYRKTSVPLIGFYDGMFGPGAGSFFTLAGVSLRKLPIVQATAQAKTLNFASNIASVIVYIISGKVIWLAAGAMIVGQTIGAWIGSHLLLTIRPELLRWLVVMVCFAVLGKYLVDHSL